MTTPGPQPPLRSGPPPLPPAIITPEGKRAYYDPRTGTYKLGRPVLGRIGARPARPFSQRSPQSQKRIRQQYRRLHAQDPGYTWQRALRDLREGRWRPYARDAGERIPQRLYTPLSDAELARFVALPEYVQPSDTDVVQAALGEVGPLDEKRDELISKGQILYDVVEAEGTGKHINYNQQRFADRVRRMNEIQLETWLAAVNSGNFDMIRQVYARVQPPENAHSAFHYHL